MQRQDIALARQWIVSFSACSWTDHVIRAVDPVIVRDAAPEADSENAVAAP
jgi:hypothetical protein